MDRILLQKKNEAMLLIGCDNGIAMELSEYFSLVSVEVEQKAPNGPPPGAQASTPEPVLPNVKHVIAIASGKGGVGKSTVASNIACGLNEKGYKVGLLDLDIYGPSLPITLGINEQPEMTNNKKLVPIDRFGLKVMSFGFISGNDTPVIWRGPLVSRMTEQFFKDVEWGELDYLIVDLPPGTGDVALDVKQYVPTSKIIVVTTPHHNASSIAVKAGLGAQQIGHEVIGVVENMSYYFNTCNQKREFIFGSGGGEIVAKKLGTTLLGQLPIGQPVKGDYLFDGKEEAGKIYNQIAIKIISEMNL